MLITTGSAGGAESWRCGPLPFAALVAGTSMAATFLAGSWIPYCGPYESLFHVCFRLGGMFSRTLQLDPNDPDTDERIRKADILPLTSVLTRFIMWKNGFKEERIRVPSKDGSHEIEVYIMRPSKKASKPLPLLVIFHGGGMVEGSAMDAGIPLLGVLGAFKNKAVIASVEYRLSPKYKFPTGVQDCIDATRALFSSAKQLGCDPENISVGGLSAGGMCAAVLHRYCAANNMKLKFCAMYCPMLRFLPSTPSWIKYAHVWVLKAERMIWYWQCFATPSDAASAGGFRPVDLQPEPGPHLAPCLVATNTLDVLRDEAKEYAQRLRDAGVEVHEVEAYGAHFSGFATDRRSQQRCLAVWQHAVLGAQ